MVGETRIVGTTFADDENHPATNRKEVQKILDLVAESSAKEGSRYKPDKAKVLAIGGQKEWANTTWKMGSISVMQVKETTYLGRHIPCRHVERSK